VTTNPAKATHGHRARSDRVGVRRAAVLISAIAAILDPYRVPGEGGRPDDATGYYHARQGVAASQRGDDRADRPGPDRESPCRSTTCGDAPFHGPPCAAAPSMPASVARRRHGPSGSEIEEGDRRQAFTLRCAGWPGVAADVHGERTGERRRFVRHLARREDRDAQIGETLPDDLQHVRI
jgi:hypothetical protein